MKTTELSVSMPLVPLFIEPPAPVKVPTSAATLTRTALALGWVVDTAMSDDERFVVEGVHRERGVGFRAWWIAGRAAGATWHERTARYEVLPDTRPEHDAKVERRVKGKVKLVPDPRRKPAGIGSEKLTYVAGPRGVPIGVTEVTRRVKGL